MLDTIGELSFKYDNQNLTVAEFRKLSAFLVGLAGSSSKKKHQLIFRGENYQSLKSKFKLTGDELNFHHLSDMLFMIGEKGRGYRKSYRDKIKKYKLFSITDSSSELFKYIFLKYRDVLSIMNYQVTDKFKRENVLFTDFFLNKKNEQFFVETIMTFTKGKREIARDFYLKPLHQIGQSGYYNNSVYLSTTPEIKVANYFSNYKDSSSPVIIVGWIGATMKNNSFGLTYADKAKTFLDGVKLPVYSGVFFPKQKEVTLRGGMFPHYILGYILKERMEFNLNPHFFSTEKSFTEIIKNGFDIDQTHFFEALRQTDYEGSFWLDEEDNFGDTV